MAEEAKIDLKALEAITKKVLAYKPNKKDRADPRINSGAGARRGHNEGC